MPTRRDALGMFMLPFACGPHAVPVSARVPPPPKGRTPENVIQNGIPA